MDSLGETLIAIAVLLNAIATHLVWRFVKDLYKMVQILLDKDKRKE